MSCLNVTDKSTSLCVGLFGTCGNSTWRLGAINRFEKANIPFFNPQVEDWNPSLAEIEAWHLAHDKVIVFPVLDETHGIGSLAETGFSIMQALKFDDRRDIIVLIEPSLDGALCLTSAEQTIFNSYKSIDIEELTDALKSEILRIREKEARAKDSVRARALVRAHLNELRIENVYIVDTLEDLVACAVRCFGAASLLSEMREQFNPHRKGQ